MFRLTIVAGPARGATYAVKEGETTIGRVAGNAVQLVSARVSKNHCKLIASNGELLVQDTGSSNGTFVNGVLARNRKIAPGDRISVGEYVFEVSRIVQPPPRRAAPQQQAESGYGNVIQLQPRPASWEFSNPVISGVPLGSPVAAETALPSGPPVPSDLKGKLLFYFDQYFMPIFYNLNFSNEWRLISVSMISLFVIANLLISVYPVLNLGHSMVLAESGRRAQGMARQLVERNAAALAARAEGKTEIGSIEREDGVRVALIVDLDLRIIAPGNRTGQYLTSGPEARVASKVKEQFRKGRETGVLAEPDASTTVAIEPIKILVPQFARNATVAMAVVSIDTSLATPSIGEMGVIYAEVLILTGALAGLLLLVLYRLTLKPFLVLNDDIDRALKGDSTQVTHEFKWEELDSLWNVINSTLQRAASASGTAAVNSGWSHEDVLASFRSVGDASGHPMVVCDNGRQVAYLNSPFEEVSGIRSEVAIGKPMTEVARDQAFGALVSDLFDRAQASGAEASDDFEFSGTSYKVRAATFGPVGNPRGYVLMAVKT